MPLRDYSPFDPAVTVANIKAAFDTIRTEMAAYTTNLTPAERKTYAKEGQKGEAFVTRTNAAMHNNSGSVPSDFESAKFDNNVAVYDGMKSVLSYGRPIIESMYDTQMCAGVNSLALANNLYGHFKVSAKANTPLSDELAELGKFYKGRGTRYSLTNFDIAVSTSAEISDIAPNSTVINTGNSTLTLKVPAETTSGLKKLFPVKLAPGASFKLPKGITTIIVSNDSTSVAGSISVKIK